jgi:F-type H+-transporting ATPase subunit epsilon
MAETANQLRVRLVTPEQILIDEMADAVEIPSRSGYIEALYGHAPLLAELGVGHVRLHGSQSGDDKDLFVVAWGFCEILPDRVTILAASAAKPDMLDRASAERELEAGKKMWSEAGEDAAKYEEANEVIYEAEARLATIQGSRY